MKPESTENEENEYERLRQENILKNKELLAQLSLDPTTRPRLPTAKTSSSASSSSASTRRRAPRKVPTESPLPRRTSSRLAGLPADSEAAKRKAIDEDAALQAASAAKRSRVSGDLSFELKKGLLADVGRDSFESTFTEEDIKATSDKDLRSMREKMSGLRLYDEFPVADLKLTPERIYHLAFHPTATKPLIFASDKVGNLGIFDAASTSKETPDGDPTPDISTFKVHARTISAFTFDSTSPTSLYTSSYDGSIRLFNLTTGVASEVHTGPAEDDEALSGVDIVDGHTIYFSTLLGRLGRRDTRAPESEAELWSLSEKKIGGFGLHPGATHLCATGSLDRTVKVWDLRRLAGTGEGRRPALLGSHTSRLSVSCALWSGGGTLATTSYDDTIKLYHFPNALSWGADSAGKEKGKGKVKVKKEVVAEDDGEESPEIEPTYTIRHNNQTGRWVTILRAQWQQHPQDGQHKFVIANMNRSLDIYTSRGQQLAQLTHESITAVPAVAQFHPTMDWVAGGTGSGKLVLFR